MASIQHLGFCAEWRRVVTALCEIHYWCGAIITVWRH